MVFTRQETAKFNARNTFQGVSIFVFDVALLGVFTFLAVWFSAWYLQLACALVASTIIAALFVVAHDAAHGALTQYRWLNRLIGTLAFLPALHPYSLWVELHNLRHHRWTNLLGKDDVWTPYDLDKYRALPWYSRWAYRFYRSVYGPLLYYLVEFWGKKFTWPRKKHYDPVKREYVIDTLLVWAFAIGYIAFLVYGAGAGWFGGVVRPWWNPVLFGAVLPFFVWNVYSGLSIYLHHTHPRNVWFKDEQEWRRVSKAHTSVHAVFPKLVQRAFHFIMEHSIHHLRPGVPLYHLSEAQTRLEEEDHRVVAYRWTPAIHMSICRRCKLYDFDAKRWMDFDGNYTSSPARLPGEDTADDDAETVDSLTA